MPACAQSFDLDKNLAQPDRKKATRDFPVGCGHPLISEKDSPPLNTPTNPCSAADEAELLNFALSCDMIRAGMTGLNCLSETNMRAVGCGRTQ